MALIVILDHGSYLAKKKDRFYITFGMSHKPPSYIPANRVEGLLIDAKVTITSGAFDLIANYGIPVIWNKYDSDGLMLTPFELHGTVSVRREQYKSHEDERGLLLAKKFVQAATENKLTTLRRIVRYIPELKDLLEDYISKMKKYLDENFYNNITELIINNQSRNELMSYEAKISKVYLEALRVVLNKYNWNFGTRSRRPGTDLFNAMLNYGYAVLKGQLTHRLSIVGLDIYGGFLHVDRSGRESLILDLMEEFRQVVVDEALFKLIISGEISDQKYNEDQREIKLDKTIKSKVIKSIFGRLNLTIRDHKIIDWIHIQSREISNYCRSPETPYTPFLMKVRDPW